MQVQRQRNIKVYRVLTMAWQHARNRVENSLYGLALSHIEVGSYSVGN